MSSVCVHCVTVLCLACDNRPAGKLKLSIKATWLKHAKVDVDALTELSFNTHRSTDAGELEEPGEEQVSEQPGCLCMLL